MGDAAESLGRRFAAVRPHLNELQRRLWLGAEAAELGGGGVAVVAAATGVAADTVRRGRAEIRAEEVAAPGRSRLPGGGRKRAEEHDPDLVAALAALVDPVTRGDPESALLWTTKSTRKLAAELTAAGHRVSDFVVRRLLREMGFSLQANSKTAEGRDHPDRDAQFSYLNDQVKDHQAGGEPVISVDTKKKELVGEYKNKGTEWRPKGDPVKVQVHDFIGKQGRANPYGVYDITDNTGWVSVGTDHDTAAFAVNTIRTWWNTIGRETYPEASRLLITADGGGSNGYKIRLWKTELAALAAETGLVITVCHLPPGTSKWNKIEHRLFAHISMNWRGRPLTSHDVIINTIAATTTTTGLKVRAGLDTTAYPKGIKIDDKTMKTLKADGTHQPHDWHGEWNYTIHPATPNNETTVSLAT